MSYIKKEIGHNGEEIASQYLEQLGYDILKRNYYDFSGEIDIIAYKNSIIHFIEVKSVSCETKNNVIHETYNPAEKVDKRKLKRIEKVAQKFLFENGLEEELYQFGLIIVYIYDGGFNYKIELIENININ